MSLAEFDECFLAAEERILLSSDNLQDGHHINNVNRGQASPAPGPGSDTRPPTLINPWWELKTNTFLLFKSNPNNGSIYTSWTKLASPVIRQISSLDSDKTFHLCKLHENSIRDGSRGENCLSNFFCLWFMPWDLVLISAPSSAINNQLLIGPSCEPRPLIGMREIVRDCSLVSHKPDTSRLKSVRKNVWLLCEHLLAFAEVRSSPECKVSAEFYQAGNRGNEIEQTIDLVSSSADICRVTYGPLCHSLWCG